MAHGTLVGGTAYEIIGGRCLVGGTGYDIFKGRTLVDGTGYDVDFVVGPALVTITGTGDESFCYSTIAGTQYYKATSGIEVLAGDSISFSASSSGGLLSSITINGTVVAQAEYNNHKARYTWTVPEKCRKIAINYGLQISGNTYAYFITVTTT